MKNFFNGRKKLREQAPATEPMSYEALNRYYDGIFASIEAEDEGIKVWMQKQREAAAKAAEVNASAGV